MTQTTETPLFSSDPRQVHWQTIGMAVHDATDSATAIRNAHLDWNVHQAPVRFFDGTQGRALDSMRVNYRSDNGTALGVVSRRYAVVKNHEVFELADQIGEGLSYNFAGTMQGGRRVWLSANLPETTIPGDKFNPNILFSNSHDGKRAVQIFVTPIRVACSNQLNLALRSATRKWFFPHFGTVTKKMNDAKRTFQLTAQFMDELEWEAETLAVAKLGRNDLRQFIEKMFPIVDSDSERKTERIKQEIERFHDCYIADDLDNFTGTKWGLLLAVSDFVTHKPLRTVRQREAHLSKMLEGHALLDRAYSLILSL